MAVRNRSDSEWHFGLYVLFGELPFTWLSWVFMVVYFMHMVVVVQCGGVCKGSEQSGILRVSAVQAVCVNR